MRLQLSTVNVMWPYHVLLDKLYIEVLDICVGSGRLYLQCKSCASQSASAVDATAVMRGNLGD